MRNSAEQRRLLAVLVADIVGYSRLMAENEADTFYRLKDLQTSLIVPATERNHGWIVKWTGDGFLASFDSAVDAVRAAVEIQSGAAAASAAAPEDKRIRFRIGINAGDVIVVPGDVYGDTVNVAARLESAALPGGICISRGVRDTVRGKFSVDFEDRGELSVKNIPEPVGAFNVRFDPIAWTMARAEAPARSRRPAYLAIGAAILIVCAGAVGAGWYFWRQPAGLTATIAAAPTAAPATSPLREQLLARIAEAVPMMSSKARATLVDAYEAVRPHKALAVSADGAGHWRAGGRPTAENAEESALENCQIFFAHPCLLIATDSAVHPAAAGNNWPQRDMPRVGYTGPFDPEQIPGVLPSIRERADIAKYRSVPGPKAVALTPNGGRVFLVTSATDQRAAEEEALRDCDADPVRTREGGACYLYAAGDRVVLTLRLTGPLTAAASAAPQTSTTATSPISPPTPTAPAAERPAAGAPAPGALHAALARRLAAVVPGIPPRLREEMARRYELAPAAKAQAVSPDPPGLWRSVNRPDAANAEISALENCQVAYGQPCILVAVDDKLPPAPADNHWPRRDMPRIHYAGLFDPAQIPGTVPGRLRRPDIVNYRSAASPKAVVFSPNGGRVFVVAEAPNQYAAEQQALAACQDRPFAGTEKPLCLLYAAGNQVVLPRRLKEPLTAAPPN